MAIYNGTNSSDIIDARGTNDILNGNGGNDILNGGGGNDTINGGDGDDIRNAGDGNDILNGGNGNDILNGDGGNDLLTGGLGNDTLVGGAGTDVLTGGPGNDVFQFNSVSDSTPGLSRDVITDFVGNGNLPGDRIDLSRIDANSIIGGNQAFTYIGAAAFTAPGQIRYSKGILQGNTDANLSANFEIQRAGAPQLVVKDIIL